jgi:rod shape-determining protein MreD
MVNIFRGIVFFIVLVLTQVLILNNIHFLRLITPFLYIYFIIKLPVGYSSVQITILSFILGITIDILSNTPGMHAAACTLAGFSRPYIIKIFMREDLPESSSPSYDTFGIGGFIRFTGTLVILHHTALFLAESLTLFDPLFLAIRIVAGVGMTTLLICIVDAGVFN